MNLLKRTEYWLDAPGHPKRYITAPDKTAAQTKAATLAGRLGAADWTLGHDPDASYYGRFELDGKQIWVKLKTTRQNEAMQRLRTAAKQAREGQWQDLAANRERQKCATLGEILAAFELHGRVAPSSRKQYSYGLYCLVRHGLGKPALSEDDIKAQPASVLTADLLRRAQTAALAAAGADQLARDRATITANAWRRGARSLFAKRVLPLYEALVLPDLAGFLSVAPLREPVRIYRGPEPELLARVRAAAGALRETDPNCYRVWLLGLGCGLRKNELIHARWDWIQQGVDKDGQPLKVVHVQTTEDFRPKGRRDRAIPIEAAMHSELLALRVVHMDGQPGHFLEGTLWERQKTFIRFGAWLRSLGWTRRKKAHELRKLFGSQVNKVHGPYLAQQLLGHADIETTCRDYLDAVPLPRLAVFGGAS